MRGKCIRDCIWQCSILLLTRDKDSIRYYSFTRNLSVEFNENAESKQKSVKSKMEKNVESCFWHIYSLTFEMTNKSTWLPFSTLSGYRVIHLSTTYLPSLLCLCVHGLEVFVGPQSWSWVTFSKPNPTQPKNSGPNPTQHTKVSTRPNPTHHRHLVWHIRLYRKLSTTTVTRHRQVHSQWQLLISCSTH